jgi:hypothetical protein
MRDEMAMRAAVDELQRSARSGRNLAVPNHVAFAGDPIRLT